MSRGIRREWVRGPREPGTLKGKGGGLVIKQDVELHLVPKESK